MSLVFSIELDVKSLSIAKKFKFIPSISLSVGDNDAVFLPWVPQNQNQNYEINKLYQIMIAVDVFKAVESWPFTISVAMQKDQVIVGSAKFEFKYLLASALALCGRSELKSLEATLLSKDNVEIGILCFDSLIEYFPGNEHKSNKRSEERRVGKECS